MATRRGTCRRYRRKTTTKRTGAGPPSVAKIKAGVAAYKKVGNQLKNDFNRTGLGKFINYFRQNTHTVRKP